ncbi:hypothetical protein HOP54_08260 [Halomonas daqingensis]|uniref:acetyl-CoA carboxylase biotin carboxyl carrier protein n=1 Tax=Billgrantia desiderata TaxID=52021 RepID=UPI001F1CF012|nr:biotin/lipoyl-containing protein [Halomonas desiderata]MCE8028678.1 hypothetical protein [Halomonas desiderata]
MSLTHKEIVEIISSLEESSCEEFNLQMDGVDLLLRRNAKKSNKHPSSSMLDNRKETNSVENEPSKALSQSEGNSNYSPTSKNVQDANLVELVAPMNGVFYRRPSPDEPNFVEVGDEIKKGDPMCIIEVMKLFSTLYAPSSGRVASIKIEDSTSIQKGDLLITIDAS